MDVLGYSILCTFLFVVESRAGTGIVSICHQLLNDILICLLENTTIKVMTTIPSTIATILGFNLFGSNNP